MAVTPDTLSAAARRLYEQWEHLEVDGESEGWPIATLAAACAAPVDDLYDLLAVPEVPWAPAFDPVLAAELLRPQFAADVLAWLGQFAGVQHRADLPAVGQRLRIMETGGARRGTVASIVAAARTRAIGPDGSGASASVILLERVNSDPYHLAVTMYLGEVPFPELTRGDIERELPAGRRGTAREYTNLIENPSAEVDLTGWAATGDNLTAGATLTRSNARAKFGAWSVRIQHTAGGATQRGAAYDLGELPEGNYTLSLWLYAAAAAAGTEIWIGRALGSSPPNGPTELSTDVEGEWVQLSGVFSTDGTDSCRILVRNPGSVAFDVHIDGVMLTAGGAFDHPDVYQDGSTPDADGQATNSWSGAAHASTSLIHGRRPRFDFNLVTGGNFDSLTGAFATFDDVTAEFATFDELTANPLGV